MQSQRPSLSLCKKEALEASNADFISAGWLQSLSNSSQKLQSSAFCLLLNLAIAYPKLSLRAFLGCMAPPILLQSQDHKMAQRTSNGICCKTHWAIWVSSCLTYGSKLALSGSSFLQRTPHSFHQEFPTFWDVWLRHMPIAPKDSIECGFLPVPICYGGVVPVSFLISFYSLP